MPVRFEVSAIEVSLRICRSDRDRLVVARCRVVESALVLEDGAQIVVGVGMIGIELEGRFVPRRRDIEPPGAVMQQAIVKKSLSVAKCVESAIYLLGPLLFPGQWLELLQTDDVGRSPQIHSSLLGCRRNLADSPPRHIVRKFRHRFI